MCLENDSRDPHEKKRKKEWKRKIIKEMESLVGMMGFGSWKGGRNYDHQHNSTECYN